MWKSPSLTNDPLQNTVPRTPNSSVYPFNLDHHQEAHGRNLSLIALAGSQRRRRSEALIARAKRNPFGIQQLPEARERLFTSTFSHVPSSSKKPEVVDGQLKRKDRTQEVGSSNQKTLGNQFMKPFIVKLNVKEYKAEELTVEVDGDLILIEGKNEKRIDEYGFMSRKFTTTYQLTGELDVAKMSCTISSEGVLSISGSLLIRELSKEIPIISTNVPDVDNLGVQNVAGMNLCPDDEENVGPENLPIIEDMAPDVTQNMAV